MVLHAKDSGFHFFNFKIIQARVVATVCRVYWKRLFALEISNELYELYIDISKLKSTVMRDPWRHFFNTVRSSSNSHMQVDFLDGKSEGAQQMKIVENTI